MTVDSDFDSLSLDSFKHINLIKRGHDNEIRHSG